MSYQRVLYDIKRRERLYLTEPEGAANEARPAPARNVGFAPLPRPEPVGAGVYTFGERDMTDAERWAHSGDWRIIEGSTNVNRIAYNKISEKLYVEFKNWLPGMPIGLTDGAGSIYRYGDVTLPEAISFYNATSAGTWVWDSLRVRGTWSGHKKPYALEPGQSSYLPRIAIMGNDSEWFKQRAMWSRSSGKYYTSELPESEAPDLALIARLAERNRRKYGVAATDVQAVGDGVVQPSTQPNRGTPNRGNQAKPNRGK